MVILLNSLQERWGDDGLEEEAKVGKKTEDFNSTLMSFSVFCRGQAMCPNLGTDTHYLFLSYTIRIIQSITLKVTIG